MTKRTLDLTNYVGFRAVRRTGIILAIDDRSMGIGGLTLRERVSVAWRMLCNREVRIYRP